MIISRLAILCGFCTVAVLSIPLLFLILVYLPSDINQFSIQLINKKLLLANECADIISIGDSSGLYALDPKIIKSVTGKSFYNLNMQGSVGYDAHKTVVSKLNKHHCTPLVYILYMHPSNLIYDRSKPAGAFPRLYFQTKSSGWSGFIQQITRHPMLTLKTYKMLIRIITKVNQSGNKPFINKFGHAISQAPPLKSDCSINRLNYQYHEFELTNFIHSIKKLTKTPILVVSSSSPLCANRNDYIVIHKRADIDIHMAPMPSQYFVDDTHVSPIGSKIISWKLGSILNKRLFSTIPNGT